MSEFVLSPPPVVAAPVRGRSARVPLRRIFCVGRNYEAHAREMGVAVDREAPFYFTKSAEHYVASGSRVPYPPGTSNYHYELDWSWPSARRGFVSGPETRCITSSGTRAAST